MKIIDVNCAIGAPLVSPRFTTAEGLLKWMDDYRIGSALVHHTEAQREPHMANALMRQISAESNGRIRACMALNPSLEDLGLPGEGAPVERLKALRPSAVRAFPDAQKYPFTAFYAAPILEVCQQLRMPLIVDVSYTDMFLAMLPEICEKYPDVPLILPRFGLNRSRQYMRILEKLPNVYLDMSIMLDTGSIEEICRRFGSEHLLFGSGLPTYEPGGALGLLYYAQISDADKANIAYANFERLEQAIRWDA